MAYQEKENELHVLLDEVQRMPGVMLRELRKQNGISIVVHHPQDRDPFGWDWKVPVSKGPKVRIRTGCF